MATPSLQLSLLAISTDDTEASKPLFLVQEEDLWRKLDPPEPLDEQGDKESFENNATPTPQQVETFIDVTLKEILGVEPFVPETRTSLEDMGKIVFRALLPRKLRDRIRDAKTPLSSDEDWPTRLPILRVYAHPNMEWIPWELMHDDQDFLGLRFQIARLPILMAQNTACQHGMSVPVTTARSFLGAGLLDQKDPEFLKWQDTFSFLAGKLSEEIRYPDDNAGRGHPLLNDVSAALKAHEGIIHVTCHGVLVGQKGRNFAWNLKDPVVGPEQIVYQIKSKNLTWLQEGAEIPPNAPRPLVFGNACGGAGQGGGVLGQGFGRQLIEVYGAAAYVGAFAKVTLSKAVAFADRFYPNLLDEAKPLTIGQALWKTKSDCNAAGDMDPSWLFYCLWGIPDTRFHCPSPIAQEGG